MVIGAHMCALKAPMVGTQGFHPTAHNGRENGKLGPSEVRPIFPGATFRGADGLWGSFPFSHSSFAVLLGLCKGWG